MPTFTSLWAPPSLHWLYTSPLPFFIHVPPFTLYIFLSLTSLSLHTSLPPFYIYIPLHLPTHIPFLHCLYNLSFTSLPSSTLHVYLTSPLHTLTLPLPSTQFILRLPVYISLPSFYVYFILILSPHTLLHLLWIYIFLHRFYTSPPNLHWILYCAPS